MMQRRAFLKTAGLAALATTLSSVVRSAFARARPTFAFEADKLDAAVAELYGGTFAESDAVKFKAPEIAENGAVVPVTVQYDGPAKGVAVLVEENPQPLAAAFELSPNAPALVATRIKMGTTSRVAAVVQTADGQLVGTAREVKVTIGGCGG